ncbi:hypothetical protein A3Q56_01991 [Intoshia linei]|uniref:Uncharacterized protein n=1 Tax=Intoshia linei TaxID=1819745 RepID=A0A177B7I0_9BILA|nr:hypothetical protein A3Q56_01991 [Intoshia linei]
MSSIVSESIPLVSNMKTPLPKSNKGIVPNTAQYRKIMEKQTYYLVSLNLMLKFFWLNRLFVTSSFKKLESLLSRNVIYVKLRLYPVDVKNQHIPPYLIDKKIRNLYYATVFGLMVMTVVTFQQTISLFILRKK